MPAIAWSIIRRIRSATARSFGSRGAMRNRATLLAPILTGALAGCSMAPAYHVPVTTTPAAFKEAGPWVAATPGDPAAGGQWWSLYGDQTLDGLEAKIE